jgi:O-antigen/teichoic acid export membrane protein
MIKNMLIKFKSSDLLKTGFWYTFGNFFQQGINFITISIFTRILPIGDYGTYSVYTTWLSVFTCLISLGIASSISTAKYDFEEEFDQYISSVLFLGIIMLGVFIGLGYIFKEPLGMLLGISSKIIIILFMNSFFMYVMDIITTKYTILGRYKSYVFISIASALGTVLLSIVMILNMTSDKYMGRVLGGFIVSGVFAVVITISLLRNGRKLINKNYWSYGLKVSLPLIPHVLSGIILMQFGRIMINHYSGASATGVYSFAYNLGTILNVFYSATNKAWLPWFFQNMSEQNYDEIKEKAKYYIILFTFVTFLLIFVTPEIVAIMAGEEYKSGTQIVPIIILSNFFIFLYSLPVNLEFYLKKTYFISVGTLACGVLNIVLNVIFIPKYGAIAGAWTTLVSTIVLFIFHYVIARKLVKEVIFPIKYFVISTVVISLVGIVYYFIANTLIIRYIVLIAIMIVTVIVAKNKYKML